MGRIRITRGWNRLNPPASELQISGFEESIGRVIPRDMRSLLARHNGLTINENTMIDCLPAEGQSHNDWISELEDAASQFLSFGNDVSDGLFGVWCRKSSDKPSPVIDVSDFSWSAGCVQVASLDLAAFLTTRTVYYLLLVSDDWDCPIPHVRERASKVTRGAWNEALDVLEVPARIRQLTTCMDEAAYRAVQRWAEPDFDKLPSLDEDWTNESLANVLGP